jgi:hypothetical protein
MKMLNDRDYLFSADAIKLLRDSILGSSTDWNLPSKEEKVATAKRTPMG